MRVSSVRNRKSHDGASYKKTAKYDMCVKITRVHNGTLMFNAHKSLTQTTRVAFPSSETKNVISNRRLDSIKDRP
jgi:hypothetical protein